MLIVPLTTNIKERKLPLVTLALILINCFVYFFFQWSDNLNYMKAHQYYFESGLAEMEVPRYVEYLNKTGSQALISPQKENLSKEKFEEELIRYYGQMQSDYLFIEKLLNDQIVSENDEVYSKWKELRHSYNDQLSKVVFMEYGFKPAYRKPVTWLTHMFLHGGFGHLLGNMVFLWLVGCLIEAGCGSVRYLLIYLFGGLFAVGLFGLIYSESTVPLVGASGAIAALMGAVPVLFGKKKINIFYSLGFYFGYMKPPAIALLPVWMLNEIYQIYFGGVSNVAYVAHLGGLIGGAILAFAHSKFPGKYSEDIFVEEKVDEISPLLEKALELIGKLDFQRARRYLEEVMAKDPRNVIALKHIFNIDKHEPDSDNFHKTAGQLLLSLSQNSSSHGTAFDIYLEYEKIAPRPSLKPELFLRLCMVFSGIGRHEKGEKILTFLIKHRPDLPNIPAALLKVADAYKKEGRIKKWESCLNFLCSKYGGSPEARIAQTLIEEKLS